jgi:hypothetical protein
MSTPTIFGVCRGEPMCSPQNSLKSEIFKVRNPKEIRFFSKIGFLALIYSFSDK